MKLNRLLVLSLGLSLGFAFAEGADAPDYSHVHWAQGVGVNAETGEVEGWYDAEKNDREGDADDNMCYAASASNIIAWWQDNYSAMASPGAPKALNGAAGIWDSFVQSNQDVEAGGDPLSAINWWLTGVYEPADSEGALLPKAETDVWNRYYLPYDEVAEAAEGNDEYFSGALSNFEMAGKPFNGYYYDEYGLTQQDMADFLVTAWEGDDATESGTTHSTLTMGDINVDADGDTESIYDIPFATILDESPIALAIYSEKPFEEMDEPLAHALTLWGVEFDEEGNLLSIWLTDSDDEEEALFNMSVVMDGEADRIYLGEKLADGSYTSAYGADVFIVGVYAINSSVAANWQLVPEPATATLSLLALAAMATRRRRC